MITQMGRKSVTVDHVRIGRVRSEPGVVVLALWKRVADHLCGGV